MKINDVALFEKDDWAAYEKEVAKRLRRKGFTIWKRPAGNDVGFPDIGASIDLPSGEINLHIEAKSNAEAQWGTVMWVYREEQFIGRNFNNPMTEMVIGLLNRDEQALSNAQTMLKDLKRYADSDIDEISQQSLNHISDLQERHQALVNYMENRTRKSTVIASFKGSETGEAIIEYYRSKYQPHRGNDLLMYIIGHEMFIDHYKRMPSDKLMNELFEALNIDGIPSMPTKFDGELRSFVNIRNVTFGGEHPVRLDPLARVRARRFADLQGPILR